MLMAITIVKTVDVNGAKDHARNQNGKNMAKSI